MENYKGAIVGSWEPELRPFTVYGGFRPAIVKWAWERGEKTMSHEFIGQRVFATQEECAAEIELIKARTL